MIARVAHACKHNTRALLRAESGRTGRGGGGGGGGATWLLQWMLRATRRGGCAARHRVAAAMAACSNAHTCARARVLPYCCVSLRLKIMMAGLGLSLASGRADCGRGPQPAAPRCLLQTRSRDWVARPEPRRAPTKADPEHVRRRPV